MPLRRLIFWIFVWMPWFAHSQSEILSRQVALTANNISLEAALDTLSTTYDVKISYSDNMIPIERVIDISYSGTLTGALELLLEDTGVNFKVIGKQIVLLPQIRSAKTHVVSGYVKDSLSGEDLIGVNIKVADTDIGIITNSYGFYSLTIPEGEHEIRYSYLGFKTVSMMLNLQADQVIDINLPESSLHLSELVIEADAEVNAITKVQMNDVSLDIQRIKKMPALLGEVDVIQNMLLLPGVQSVGEGKTGLYIRGGTSDQTLIQLDEAMIFNAFHIGGLFSVFNPDALKDATLYKGSSPVQYGGRLSSVLDVRMKEGNKQRFAATGGLGTVSSRLSLEGPINEGKGSFIISGRRTYLDLLLNLSTDPEVNRNDIFFYDLNGKVNYTINDKNRIFLSSYMGRDVFRIRDELSLKWGNFISSLRWNHVFNSRVFLNTTLLFSDFSYGFSLTDNVIGINWDSSLKNYTIKTDFSYYPDPSLELDFGYSFIWHHFTPTNITPQENHSFFQAVNVPKEHALEHGLYGAVRKKVSDRLQVDFGLRFSIFQNMGPGEYFKYEEGLPKTVDSIIDTVSASNFEVINAYYGLEPRLNARYLINGSTSLKVSYSRNKQYMHVLTNNNVGFPTDRYKPSNTNLSPQTSDQISLGVFRDVGRFTLSAEAYYKYMQNLAQVNNEPGALISNTMEQKLYIGKGWSRGLELSVRKESGKTTGWISYTLSRAWNQLAELNNGKRFHPFFDRTHDINIAMSHAFNSRITLSTNWVFNSGQALSLPVGKYSVDGKTVPLFDNNNLNGSRGPNYHRLDLAIEIKGKNKKNHRWQGSWNIAFYNLYFRKNIIGYQYRDVINDDPSILETDPDVVVETREFQAVGSYLFQFVPSVTYNFKF